MGNAKFGQARADSLKSIPGHSNGTVQPIGKAEAFYDRGAIRAQRYCRRAHAAVPVEALVLIVSL